MEVVEDRKFEKHDFTEIPLPAGDFENCVFINCNFASADLSERAFADCSFQSCNLSLVKTFKTTLNNIHFTDCKLLGIHFETCSEFLFSVIFSNCLLDLSSFEGRVMKKTRFTACSLKETDFTNSDLSASIFDRCNLDKTIFENSNLEKADFRTALNYSIDPDRNKIKKAQFGLTGLPGLLEKYDIVVKSV